MAKRDFAEVGRVETGPSTEVVIQKVFSEGELKGFFVNNYVKSDFYEGPKKGVTIPESKLVEVLSLLEVSYLRQALELAERKVR